MALHCMPLLAAQARVCIASKSGRRPSRLCQRVICHAGMPPSPPGTPSRAAIVWFRNDLRTADHAALHAAVSSQPASLLPLYCLDARELQPRRLLPEGAGQELPGDAAGSGLGTPRLGPFKLRALLEALSALDSELRACASALSFHQGLTEDVIGLAASRILSLSKGPAGAQGASPSAQHPPQFDALELHYHLEAGGPEGAALEAAVEQAVQAAAAAHGASCSVHRHWGCTLYHPDDLPYQLFQQAGGHSLHGKGGGGSRGAKGSNSSSSSRGVGGGIGNHASGQQEAAQQEGKQQQQQQQHGKEGDQDEEEGKWGGCGRRALVDPERLACLPPVMTAFRKVVQAHTPVRRPLPKPTALPPLPSTPGGSLAVEGTALPTDLRGVYEAAGAGEALCKLEGLAGISASSIPPPGTGPVDPRSAYPFAVTEQQGLQRLRYYLGLEPPAGTGTPAGIGSTGERGSEDASTVGYQEQQELQGAGAPIQTYQETRMMAFGVDGSAKLSPFLSLGCLSPRTVYWEGVGALQLEQEQQPQQHQREQQGEQGEPPDLPWQEPTLGDGVRWLLMHLGIRDFFIYTALKEGAGLLRPGGIQGHTASWRADEAAFQRWAAGQTGLPFVDACMRELAGSGFMSNRGRQNVASLLSKGLGLDWRLGAALFESLLVDHDFALNWGNWNYVAGTGNDPRDRQFRTVSQGEAYDPQALLIRAWVPELAQLPAELAHRPWLQCVLQEGQSKEEGADVAKGMPQPQPQQQQEQEQQQEQGQQQEQISEQQGQQQQRGAAAVREGQVVAAAGGPDEHAAAGAGKGSEGWVGYPQPIVDPQTQIRRERKAKA